MLGSLAFDPPELAAWRKAFFWDPLHSFRVASHAEQSKSVSALGQHLFGSGVHGEVRGMALLTCIVVAPRWYCAPDSTGTFRVCFGQSRTVFLKEGPGDAHVFRTLGSLTPKSFQVSLTQVKH